MRHAIYNEQGVWGIGRNLNEAMEEALDWAPKDETQFYSAFCSDDLFEHVLKQGGAGLKVVLNDGNLLEIVHVH